METLHDRPDFGGALAAHLVRSGRTCPLLRQSPYRWIRSAVQVLAGGRSVAAVEDAERLEAQLPAYQAELAAAGLPSSAWAAELPRTLSWTLAFIVGFLPAARGLGQEKLADAAVAVARELLASQARQVRRFHEALQFDEWREMAARIAELVAGKSPLALRDIARRFHDQRQARFLPVIEVMLKAGVLERDGAGGALAPPTSTHS